MPPCVHMNQYIYWTSVAEFIFPAHNPLWQTQYTKWLDSPLIKPCAYFGPPPLQSFVEGLHLPSVLAPEYVILLVERLWGDRVVPLYAILHPLRTCLLHLVNEWINVARTFPDEEESDTVIFFDNGSTVIDKEKIVKYVSTTCVFFFGVFYLTPFSQKLPLHWRQNSSC